MVALRKLGGIVVSADANRSPPSNAAIAASIPKRFIASLRFKQFPQAYRAAGFGAII
jgi:hypothetical protein